MNFSVDIVSLAVSTGFIFGDKICSSIDFVLILMSLLVIQKTCPQPLFLYVNLVHIGEVVQRTSVGHVSDTTRIQCGHKRVKYTLTNKKKIIF